MNTYKSRPFNKGSNYSSQGRRPSFGGPARSSGGRFNKKPKSRGVYIDERLFVRKAEKVEQEVYVPKHTFSDFGLFDKILDNLTVKGYKNPSPIQDQSIPVAMEGKDVIGIANTGTGKTAAFLLPLIHKMVLTNCAQKVMILAPTRELAQQIDVEFKAFTQGSRMWSVTAVGGAPIGRQMSSLERGVDFVIGTPGRVKDLINRGKIKPEQFGSIVLDEADRMLDMGFIPDITYILENMPKDKQSLFFSATFPQEIKTLCVKFLNDPVTVSVKTHDTAKSVDQDIVRVGKKEQRLDALHDILNKPECTKVLVFREMKRDVDDLGKDLRNRGIKALALHGDMRNREREHAVKSLAKGEVQVMIATDVAARGIDIPDISHVINYDIPQNYETYIHRIGRTGRGTATGKALTFVC